MAKNELVLGELVKKARKEKYLSARKLAELCDISHTEINNIEKGVRIRPAILTLKGFEKYLGLDYQEMCRLAGYCEDTIKCGDENITISYEKYDQIIKEYRQEIEHAISILEQKRQNAKNIKEYIAYISKYIDNLENVPIEIKKKIKKIYALLEDIDTKYENLMQEK